MWTKFMNILGPWQAMRWTLWYYLLFLLRQVLKSIKEEMRQNPTLELPYDPDQDIWSYYSIIRVSPIIIEDVILTVPLVDKSLQMDLYKVHNLPALHPKLNIQFTYQLEGKYLVVGKHGLCSPTLWEWYKNMHDNFWRFVHDESSLISHRKIEWCIYALFIKDPERIAKFCLVETKARHANLAVSLEGYMWAISSMATTKLQIRRNNTPIKNDFHW